MDEKCVDGADSCNKQGETENEKPKTVRHRTKKIYNAIRNQMEFYFGDANLSKDRYMRQLITDDPYIPLEIFLKFNKMKKFVTSTQKIAKALTNSKLLELNEDQTKVRRITEIPKERNVDDRSIYVECLPRNADHDWVINVFSRYGPIEYVSIPRYKHSRRIKEFAFVEFERPESAQKALNSFKVFNGVLCPNSTEPSLLTSVTSYIKEQLEEKEGIDEKEGEEGAQEIVRPEKRRKSTESSTESETSEPPSKRSNLVIENNENEQDQTNDVASKENNTNENERKSENGDENVDVSKQENENTVTKSKKKRKKHKKKSANNIQGIDNDVMELKVMSKKDWKRLRNQYLNLQRAKIAEAKRQLHNLSNRTPKARETNKFPIKSTRNMNFYGANQDTMDEDTDKSKDKELESIQQNPALLKQPLFQYEPGIIVQFKFPQPCVDIKDFKSEMKQYPYVKYVDVKEGALEAFVRCDSPTNATTLIKQASCIEHMGQVINGQPELEYWKKIMKDREQKFNKKVKVNPVRGREKVVKAIAKHIRFDDEE